MILVNIKDSTKLKARKTTKLMDSAQPSNSVQQELRKELIKLWTGYLLPATATIRKMIDSGATPEQIGSFISRTLDNITTQFNFELTLVMDKWKMSLDEKIRAKFDSGLRRIVTGVDLTVVVSDPDIKSALDISLFNAVDLIKSTPRQYFGQVAKAVADNFFGVPQPEDRTLVEQIMELNGGLRSRATIIARDQTSKMTAALNQARQQSIGVDTYIWRTVKDNRVVGKPDGRYPEPSKAHENHYIMEGKHCRWGDATVWSEDQGKTWVKRPAHAPKTHPGQDILCRCHSQAVIDIEKILESV